MAIGLGLLRAAGRGSRAGRVKEDERPARPTVREVCLIGVDRRASAEVWPAGQEVAWLGRTYRVVASDEESSGPSAAARRAGSGRGCATGRRYVHLSHRDRD